MCLQPPPTTITLGAIVNEGYGRAVGDCLRFLFGDGKESDIECSQKRGVVGLCVRVSTTLKY